MACDAWQGAHHLLTFHPIYAILTVWTKHKPFASTHKVCTLLTSVSLLSLLSVSLLSVLTLLLLVLRVLLVLTNPPGKSIGELSTASWLLPHSLPYLTHDLHSFRHPPRSHCRACSLCSRRLHLAECWRVYTRHLAHVTRWAYLWDWHWRHLYARWVHVSLALIVTLSAFVRSL